MRDASVVICSFSERRWGTLRGAVESVGSQTLVPAEIILVVDRNRALADRARQEWPHLTVLENEHAPGLSGGRNTGLGHATSSIVAFLDDDAVAARDWLERLVSAYADPRVVAAGGEVEPSWEAARPPWFPPEFDWVVGCSHAAMPKHDASVRNVIGANMSFRRDALLAEGGFREGLGRLGDIPEGCEETEACIRLARRDEARVLYRPSARVLHAVSGSRGTWSYFLARCRAEGRSKARLARLVGRDAGLEAERAYTLRTLPTAVARNLAQVARGEPSGLGRSAAIVLGLLSTAGGYAAEAAGQHVRGLVPSPRGRGVLGSPP
jgi:O-antigen biosynthesis protein